MINPALCQCPVAGWCERHQMQKHVRHWQLCQGINCTPEQSAQRRVYWDSKVGVVTSISHHDSNSAHHNQTLVTVAIICHNYGRFLTECVNSVQAQTYSNIELLVIDDSSTDETSTVCEQLGIPPVYVEHQDVHENRCLAYHLAKGHVICFLDADDVLPPDYVENGLKPFSDPSVAIVYSDLQKFGNSASRTNYPPEANFQTIEFDNVIHAGSLVRRDVLEITKAMGKPMSQSAAHADWMIWRRVLRHGYKAVKQESLYHYRQHGQNMWQTQVEKTYYEQANLRECPITLVIPLAGRTQYWQRTLDTVEKIVTCENLVSVVFLDTSRDLPFADMIRPEITKFKDVRYVRLDVGDPRQADRDRNDQDICQDVNLGCTRIYNWVQNNVTTETTLILEDDVFPHSPETLVKDLLSGLDFETGIVTGAYVNRQTENRYIAFRERGGMIPLGMEGRGLERIYGAGFGCLLLRTSVLKKVPLSCRILPWEQEDVAYDISFFGRLEKTGVKVKINWDVRCDHAHVTCPVPAKPVPRDEWPLPARMIANLATIEDKGVGDTIKRVIGRVGVFYQTMMKALTGSTCKGCGFRQQTWNDKYPYHWEQT